MARVTTLENLNCVNGIINICCHPVSLTRMGHSDARGEKSHQPDVDGESQQEDYSRRGSQASLDLCTYSQDSSVTVSTPSYNTFSLIHPCLSPISGLFTATRTRGVRGAQTGDGGLPKEVQCPPETQGSHPNDHVGDTQLLKYEVTRVSLCF